MPRLAAVVLSCLAACLGSAAADILNFHGHKLNYVATQGSSRNPSVLLLHGARFSSATWVEIGTTSALGNAGFQNVAIDLPGYGESEKAPTDDDWLFKLTRKFQDEGLLSTNVIVLAASMSGTYAIPTIFDHPSLFAGLIAVAPVGTQRYSQEMWENMSLPTLIVYGENDKGIGVPALEMLEHAPNHETHMMENAGHFCYYEAGRADEFHDYVLGFLKTTKQAIGAATPL